MDNKPPRALTGAIAWRLWAVAAVFGGLSALLLVARFPGAIGGSLATIALLAVPLALVVTLAWIAGLRAGRLPRLFLWLGLAGCVVGVAGLIANPGWPPMILALAAGAWFLLVGAVASVIVAGRG